MQEVIEGCLAGIFEVKHGFDRETVYSCLIRTVEIVDLLDAIRNCF